VPATSSFWAEDGQILYQAALTRPVFANLTSPYDGYLQLVSRMAIETTQLFPVADASAVAAVAGNLILALSALLVFHAARGHLRSPLSRCLLVGAMVLLPVAGGELLSNVINLEWWLLFAAFWVVLWRPSARWERAVAGLFCFVTAATTPVAACYLPILAARGAVLPRRKEHAATFGLLAGLAVQVPAIIFATGGGGSAYPKSTDHIASLFLIRVASGSLTGVAWTDTIIAHAATAGEILGAAILTALIGLVLASRSLRVYVFAAVALALSVVLFSFELWYRGAGLWMNGMPAIFGGRYVQTPTLLLLSVLIVAADRLAPTISGRRVSLGVTLVAACLIPAWVSDFQTANWRSAGPNWPAEVAQATRDCATTSVQAETLAIAPAGWFVVVPCDDLR
jgi:hypothetical protein